MRSGFCGRFSSGLGMINPPRTGLVAIQEDGSDGIASARGGEGVSCEECE